MLPGSVDSMALLLSNVSVPPLWLDALTTPVVPALNAALEPLLLLLLLLLLPPQAARTSAATAPAAARAIPLFRFIG